MRVLHSVRCPLAWECTLRQSHCGSIAHKCSPPCCWIGRSSLQPATRDGLGLQGTLYWLSPVVAVPCAAAPKCMRFVSRLGSSAHQQRNSSVAQQGSASGTSSTTLPRTRLMRLGFIRLLPSTSPLAFRPLPSAASGCPGSPPRAASSARSSTARTLHPRGPSPSLNRCD